MMGFRNKLVACRVEALFLWPPSSRVLYALTWVAAKATMCCVWQQWLAKMALPTE
jgi:hypothetical protein